MSTITILGTLLLCFTLSMCSGSKDKSIDDMSDPELSALPDTSDVPPLPSPPVPVAPGTALITATIFNTEAVEEGFHCTLKVDRVYRYGSTTPPIPVGTELKALIAPQVIEKINSTASFESLMAPESTLDLTLRYAGMAKMAGSDALDWQVASVKQ